MARLEAECLGQDAWSEGLVREGISGALPTVTYLVAESDGVVVGHAVTSAAGDIAELQRIAVGEDRRRTGVASASSRGSSRTRAGPRPTGCCSRCARTTAGRWRSTPARASSRSTGGRATTPTARPRWCCDGCLIGLPLRTRPVTRACARRARRRSSRRPAAPRGRSPRAGLWLVGAVSGSSPGSTAPMPMKAPGTAAITREKSSDPAIGRGSSVVALLAEDVADDLGAEVDLGGGVDGQRVLAR